MGVIKEYLISVTAASVICGIIAGLIKKDSAISAVVKLLSGIFLTITILSPIIKLPLTNITLHIDSLSDEAENTVQVGKQIATEEMKAIITTNVQAYILEKAEKLGADIEVEVFLQDLIPKSVRIIGQTAPYTKLQLSGYITDNLDIPVEEQQWID